MSDPETNGRTLDAAYKAFPSFSVWQSETSVDTARWDRYNSSLKAMPGLSQAVMAKALEVAKRAAALDTGAIEGLYEVDRGFTYTVALETTAWELDMASKGEQVRPLFEAQLEAYDYVLSIGTSSEPISEAAIRRLHEVVCKAQSTYRVNTPLGFQDQPLPTGQYKSSPNHVRTRNGTDHSYAPVDVTPIEMQRFVSELKSPAFVAAHPIIKAAYAHYVFVVIHPFADGNGRVARALASAFTYQAISMPIVILSEQKTLYLDSLEAADNGNFQRFVDFMLLRSLDTIQLVDDSVRSASRPTIGDLAEQFKGLYRTKGGYTHDEVDAIGQILLGLVTTKCSGELGNLKIDKVSGSVGRPGNSAYPTSIPSTHRSSINVLQSFTIQMQSGQPAAARISRQYFLLLPKNASGDDDVLLSSPNDNDLFDCRVDALSPVVSGVVQMRVNMFSERVVSEMLSDLMVQAKSSLADRA